ncbi:putative purine/cytosine permease [Mycolicibacterium madagascariense]|uniref:Putative purine/cytosine permease n=1 Tax=Mycolicibacterium madagascariense TaxID=212765 RepID=A0A7I7XLN3_9MYCO|nr:cytosine permease [Mycolicibacterium madagascariense]MCV7013218.1 cytosine permease [Mycolicibacterium madagascariense]BBZ29962.1 putative purine/cytosine permease [Mycolicibacterium madagascariense]
MTATTPSQDLHAAPADHVGGIETAGVEYLPEEARDSSPRNVGAVFLGANLTWTNVVFGAFAILFGLSFWQTVTSMVVGTAVGTLAVLPTATIGPRTGTNMTVSSGAFFGIRGRFIGSGLALAIALAFAAVTVWTSGDALVAAAHRLLHAPDTRVAHAVAYAVVAALMVTVALYGHATIVAMQKVVVPVVGTLMVAGFFAFAGHVDVSAPGGNYSLGGYLPTWALSAVLFAAAPISYGPTIGDYTRRISSVRFSDRKIGVALGAGMFIGVMVPSLFGAFTALAFSNPTASYLDDLVTNSPAWYVLPIVAISLLGGLSQGVLCIYASGLDLEGLTPRLRRTQTTVITAAVAIVLLYVGVFVFDAVESVTSMTIALNALITPWIAILAIGAVRTRSYDPVDLQAFAEGRRGGRYWFAGGWHVGAVVAWVLGGTFGLLAVNTTLYVGPLSGIAGGVDLSTVGSAAIAAVVYVVSLRFVEA